MSFENTFDQNEVMSVVGGIEMPVIEASEFPMTVDAGCSFSC